MATGLLERLCGGRIRWLTSLVPDIDYADYVSRRPIPSSPHPIPLFHPICRHFIDGRRNWTARASDRAHRREGRMRSVESQRDLDCQEFISIRLEDL